LLGDVEFQSGDTAQPILHSRRAAQLNPESLSGHYNLTLAYLRVQQLQDGLHELPQALALDPRHVDAAYNLGVVLLESGKPQEALGHVRRAIILQPSDAR
jgi:tetratricopeptide (TPR) repeat protein